MIIDLYAREPIGSHHVMETKHFRLSPSPILVEGKISETSEFEEYDFVAYANQFTSSDFSISNLVAIGATDLLNKNVTMSIQTSAGVADMIENLAYVDKDA